MGGADDGDRTGRGRLGEGPVTGVARTMTRLRPRGPATRLSPNARQAAELRELGSCPTRRNRTERARGKFAEGSRGHDPYVRNAHTRNGAARSQAGWGLSLSLARTTRLAISRRASLPRRRWGAASRAVATPRVAPGPAHAGSRVAPAHGDVLLEPPAPAWPRGFASKRIASGLLAAPRRRHPPTRDRR